jgi:hypothetical protein
MFSWLQALRQGTALVRVVYKSDPQIVDWIMVGLIDILNLFYTSSIGLHLVGICGMVVFSYFLLCFIMCVLFCLFVLSLDTCSSTDTSIFQTLVHHKLNLLLLCDVA